NGLRLLWVRTRHRRQDRASARQPHAELVTRRGGAPVLESTHARAQSPHLHRPRRRDGGRREGPAGPVGRRAKEARARATPSGPALRSGRHSRDTLVVRALGARKGVKRMSTRLSLIVVAALALASLASVAFAAGYPSSAITLVIPLSPGDATDIVGRTIGEEMAKLLKVPVVPVNRPGGGMTIGIDSVVKAKKDGYTLLESPSSGLVASRILNPEAATYDPHKDLVALGRAARSPLMVTVRQDAPFKGFKDMAEFSK